MSNNIYDILGKFSGLETKDVQLYTSDDESMVESIDPQGDITGAVDSLESKYQSYKLALEEAAANKRAEAPASDPTSAILRASDDSQVKNLLIKARKQFPNAKSDVEAVVHLIANIDNETSDDQQRIKSLQAMLSQNQINQDAAEKRFRDLNAKVASGQVTAQDQAQALAAQQIEKDIDVAKTNAQSDADKQKQKPTDKIQVPKYEPPTTTAAPADNKNVYQFPKQAQKPAQVKQPAATVTTPPPTKDISGSGGGDTNLSAATKLATDANKVTGQETEVPGEEEEKSINLESIAEDSPKLEKSTITTPKTPEEFARANIEAIQRVRTDKNMPRVQLVFPGSTQVKPRADIDAFVKRLDKDFPKSKPKERNAQIYKVLSNADLFAKFVEAATTAPNVYYFYTVGKDKAKAYHLGLKQSQTGRFYSLGKPNEWAEQAFGPGKRWIPPSASDAQKELPLTMEMKENKKFLGKNKMTKINSIAEAVKSVEASKLNELDYSAKKASAGKDIGKPGKNFAKIAKDAGKRYGSKAAGERVAGAVLNKLRHGEELDESMEDILKLAGLSEGKKLKDKDQFDDVAETGDYYITSKGDKVVKTKSGIKHEKHYSGDEKDDDLDESAKPDFLDVDKDGDKEEPFKKAVKDKKQVEESIMEGKEAIRNHPIYTTKEAWDHYKKELDEQTTTEGVRDIQQELDEIAALAGVSPKVDEGSEHCQVCNEAPCSCVQEEMMDESTRKHFQTAADTIHELVKAGLVDKAKEKAHHQAEVFARENPRFSHEKFYAACGLDECDWNMAPAMTPMEEGKCPACDCAPCKCDEGMMEAEMEEGNEFSGALADAKAAGAKEFEVDGKKYTVKEDINVNITANGEQDALNLLRKLSGMATKEVEPIIAFGEETCDVCGSAECGCEPVAEDAPNLQDAEPRDVEHLNTPREKYAGAEAAYPSGTDQSRSKIQDPRTANKAANPLAEQDLEESLWKQYESIISDIKVD